VPWVCQVNTPLTPPGGLPENETALNYSLPDFTEARSMASNRLSFLFFLILILCPKHLYYRVPRSPFHRLLGANSEPAQRRTHKVPFPSGATDTFCSISQTGYVAWPSFYSMDKGGSSR
jgi:hypothetical protein